MTKQPLEMQTWWCVRCNVHLACLGAVEVRCAKGHRMRRAETDVELLRLKAMEGVS